MTKLVPLLSGPACNVTQAFLALPIVSLHRFKDVHLLPTSNPTHHSIS